MKPTTHKNPNSGAKDDKKMTKQQLTKQKVRNTLNKSNKKNRQMGISITKKNLHWCSWGAPLKQENSDAIFHEKKQIKQFRIQWVKERDK